MKKSLIVINIITLISLQACRSNQEIIQQSVSNLTAQSKHIPSTPPPVASSWGAVAAGAGITLVIVAVIVAIILYRDWRKAIEKAAYEKHKGDFKAREARQQASQNPFSYPPLTMPQPPLPPRPQQLTPHGSYPDNPPNRHPVPHQWS